jgi:phage terminase large subunit-like protein
MILTKDWQEFPEHCKSAVRCGWIPLDRDYDKIKPKDWTRAERVMAFIEKECKVPEGSQVGKPVILSPFQRMFIRAVYDNPNTATRRAILSIARKNGKTGLIAPLVLAHIIGPEARKNSQTVSGAMNRQQAGIVFDAMAKMINLNTNMTARAAVVPSQKSIKGITTGVTYRALAKDGAGAQGLSPAVAVLDEAGQIVGPTDAFFDAITTSQGAHDNPLLLVISTQAASDSDLLSIWIDDAQRSNDPSTVCHVYEADKDSDLMDENQWYKSNPALGVFRNIEDLRTQLSRAARMPTAEPSARNLLLNQRVSLLTLAVAPSVWKLNGAEPNDELFYSYPVHCGLDLSARNDLTACVLSVLDPETGLVHTKPIVFTPLDNIEDRARQDRAPYDTWAKSGHMIALPGRHLDYGMIAEELAKQTKGMTIASVQFDRWRIDDFKPRADEFGFASESEWIPVGQGFKDFSLRVDGLDSLLLQGKIRHGMHPLLNLGAANAVVVTDPSGSKKYDKSKSSQRIDTLVALAMSVYPLSDGVFDEINIDSMIV